MFGLGKTDAEKWWSKQSPNVKEQLANQEFNKEPSDLSSKQISYIYFIYGIN